MPNQIEDKACNKGQSDVLDGIKKFQDSKPTDSSLPRNNGHVFWKSQAGRTVKNLLSSCIYYTKCWYILHDCTIE